MRSEPEKIYDSDPSEDTSWMLTYGDTITLLMIFFVLMFSSSKISEEKFDKVRKELDHEIDGAISMIENITIGDYIDYYLTVYTDVVNGVDDTAPPAAVLMDDTSAVLMNDTAAPADLTGKW